MPAASLRIASSSELKGGWVGINLHASEPRMDWMACRAGGSPAATRSRCVRCTSHGCRAIKTQILSASRFARLRQNPVLFARATVFQGAGSLSLARNVCESTITVACEYDRVGEREANTSESKYMRANGTRIVIVREWKKRRIDRGRMGKSLNQQRPVYYCGKVRRPRL